MFTFKALHNFHLSISNLSQNCFVSHLSSNNVIGTMVSGTEKMAFSTKSRSSTAASRCSGKFNATIPYPAKWLIIKEGSILNIEQYIHILRPEEMLEGKDYRSLDPIFQFVATFPYRCRGSFCLPLTYKIIQSLYRIVKLFQRNDHCSVPGLEAFPAYTQIGSVIQEMSKLDFQRSLRERIAHSHISSPVSPS